MRKVLAITIMAAMLLAIGVAAMATEADWLFLMRASSPTYLSYGPNLNLGVAPTASEIALGTTATGVGYVGATDGTSLFGTSKPASIGLNQTVSWDLRLWAGTTYPAGTTTLRVAWWTVATKALPTTINGVNYTYTLEVVGDATKKVVWENGIPAGTSTAPVGYWDFTNFSRIAATDAINSGIQLKFTAAPSGGTIITPEPSSMVALASGLFGLVGFGIRRRK
jgi:hypothetical protein